MLLRKKITVNVYRSVLLCARDMSIYKLTRLSNILPSVYTCNYKHDNFAAKRHCALYFSFKIYRYRCKQRDVFLGCKGLRVYTHQKNAAFFFFCMIFFEVLLLTDTASVVNGKTSKKSMQKTWRFFGVSRP